MAQENSIPLELFFKNKRIFLTGHTGFIGSWCSIWLASLGAEVTGYSLNPPTDPSLFELAQVKSLIKTSVIGDVRNLDSLKTAVLSANPEIIIHMAAQTIVRESYDDPVLTYGTNIMGTVNILEAAREAKNLAVFLNVTTDKVYDNKEWVWGYRETDILGGADPYSNSKACSELITESYRKSYFTKGLPGNEKIAIATARAGNVIGGGDFAKDRLIPDLFRSMVQNEKITIRYPNSVRPWQHVLDALHGYLLLIERLYADRQEYSESWNFGPTIQKGKTVSDIVAQFTQLCNDNQEWKIATQTAQGAIPPEAKILNLDSTKAAVRLGWEPKWDLDRSLEKIFEWTIAYSSKKNILEICRAQISEFIRN